MSDKENMESLPKFKAGTFAYHCMNGNRDRRTLVMIEEAIHNENRGWIYRIGYTQPTELQCNDQPFYLGGGGSFWWDEIDFDELDGVMKLRAEWTIRESEIEKLQASIDKRRNRINAVKVALRVL